jgi:hypothetical protein
MGKPLGIESSGTYVCFAGGTGLLPFMDLVGQLAFANLGLNPAGTNEPTQLGVS